MTTPTYQKFIEIVFAEAIHPGDLVILQPATYDAPGLARLDQARIERESRIMSSNGSGLIGVISAAEFMTPPYNFAYWLKEKEETDEF